jgi:hypothetical protein
MSLLFLLLVLVPSEDSFSGLDKTEKPPFKIFHNTGERLTSIILAAAEDSRTFIKETTGLEINEEVTIVVLRNRKSYEQFVAKEGGERFSVGIAFTERSLLVIDASAEHSIISPASGILRHELFHIALARFSAKETIKIPLWFNEGVAQFLESRSLTYLEEQDIATLARGGQLKPFSELADGYPQDESQRRIMYLASLSFVSYLIGNEPSKLRSLFNGLKEKKDFNKAFESAFGDSVDRFQLLWQASMSKEYSFWWQFLLRTTSDYLIFAILVIVLVIVYFIRRRRSIRQLQELSDSEQEE